MLNEISSRQLDGENMITGVEYSLSEIYKENIYDLMTTKIPATSSPSAISGRKLRLTSVYRKDRKEGKKIAFDEIEGLRWIPLVSSGLYLSLYCRNCTTLVVNLRSMLFSLASCPYSNSRSWFQIVNHYTIVDGSDEQTAHLCNSL